MKEIGGLFHISIVHEIVVQLTCTSEPMMYWIPKANFAWHQQT